MTFLNLINLYQFDNTVFDTFLVPDGIDRDRAISEIMIMSGLCTPIYLEPDLFKQMVGHWCKTRMNIFTKLYSTTQLEYNPIENYDRSEETTRNLETEENSTVTGGTTINSNSERKVSAYNTEEYVNDSKTDENSITNNTDNRNTTGNTGEKYNSRVHGNIGVTTTQQMIQSEREIVKFNIYEYIAKEFDKTFMIGVY